LSYRPLPAGAPFRLPARALKRRRWSIILGSSQKLTVTWVEG
jgi:hypothetical protein